MSLTPFVLTGGLDSDDNDDNDDEGDDDDDLQAVPLLYPSEPDIHRPDGWT